MPRLRRTPSFSILIARLEAHYGKPRAPQTDDPLGLVIHENIAYLVADNKREAAFAALQKNVGLKPTEIMAAPVEELIRITRLGGIHPELRAARLKEIAQIVLNDFAGDLNRVLGLPKNEAMKALRKFPSIGLPGAEKILLFTRTHPLLALDSNGLRVLLRLGYGDEGKSYGASYSSVREALNDQIGNDCDFLIRAHQLLRRHGQELCRRNHPACEICPVRSSCSYYSSSADYADSTN